MYSWKVYLELCGFCEKASVEAHNMVQCMYLILANRYVYLIFLIHHRSFVHCNVRRNRNVAETVSFLCACTMEKRHRKERCYVVRVLVCVLRGIKESTVRLPTCARRWSNINACSWNRFRVYLFGNLSYCLIWDWNKWFQWLAM